MKRLIVTSLLIGGLGLFAAAGAGFAAKATPTPQFINTFGTTVSPPILEVDGSPGQVIHKSIKVTNGSDVFLTYLDTVADFHVSDTEGTASFDEDDASPYAAAKWIKVSHTSFSLAVRQDTDVDLVITIPTNAEAGGHYGAVIFQPKVNTGPVGSGAATIPRIGTLVLIRLPGATTENAKIVSITPKTFVGSWKSLLGDDGKTQILVASGENREAEHPKRFFLTGGTIAFDTLYKNLGTVHVKPAGTMVITNFFGQKEATLALDPRNVFPGGERRVTTVWPGNWHWGLLYSAKITALYGASNQVMTASTWFFAFPWWAIVLIIVVGLFFFLLRKRLRRIVRILIKGE